MNRNPYKLVLLLILCDFLSYCFTALIQSAKQNRKKLSLSPVENVNKVEGLRSRRGKTSIESAMELKAKRETLTVIMC